MTPAERTGALHALTEAECRTALAYLARCDEAAVDNALAFVAAVRRGGAA